MKNYNSLKELELDVKRKKLQKQITFEQIKQHHLLLKNKQSGFIKSQIISKLSKKGFSYLLKKIKNKL